MLNSDTTGQENRDLFGTMVAQTSRVMRRAVDRELRPHGLTEATWRPLLYLARYSQTINQKELAARLSLDGSSVVRLLDALQAEQLIDRRTGSQDRRAKFVSLTPKGLDTVARVEDVVREVRKRALTGLTDRQVSAAITVLDHVCHILGDDMTDEASAEKTPE